jgi:hypothetical protein
MGTRKNRKSKKSNKRFRKTRSKRQGGGEDTPTIEEQGLCGDCSICLKPMDNVNVLIATDCKHTFHKDCLRRWCQTQANKKCPLCRGDISNTCTDLSAAAASEREAREAEARAAAQRHNRELRERDGEIERERATRRAINRAALFPVDPYDSDADDPDNDNTNTRVPYNNTRNTGNQLNVIEQNYNQAFGRVPTGPRRPKKSGRGSGRSGGKKRTKKTKRRSRK